MKRILAMQRVSVAIRLVAAIGGGYAAAAGLAALAAAVLPALAVLPRSEAVVLSSMLAFVVYLVLLIWGFAEQRLARLCVILAAVGAASWGGALGLVHLTG